MSAKTTVMKIDPAPGTARPGWRWMLASGVLAIVLGLIGLVLTPLLTISAVLTLGVVMGGAAVYQLIQGTRAADWRRGLARLGYAAAYAVGGLAMVLSPAAAAAGLTIILAAVLLMGGFRGLFASLGQRERRGWESRSLMAGIPIAAGTLLLATWPASSVWAIGVGVAVIMLTRGWRNLAGAMAVRSGHQNRLSASDDETALIA